MRYSIDQLIYAEELAFPADMERLMAEHWPDKANPKDWVSYYVSWLMAHNRSLLSYVFHFSRADLKSVIANNVSLGDFLNSVIAGLIKEYGN